MISATFPYEKKQREVLGRSMAFVNEGQGDPIVFLHGNPTSSYLWRNVIPHVLELGRCIAPDLIGMGDSEKLPDSGPTSYTFVEHRRYLDALLEGLGVKGRVTLVVHDWGSALGFDWAYRHQDAVRGIAYMEALVKPRSWSEIPSPFREFLQAVRSPAGEQMVLEHNFFVERILPGGMLRSLTEEERAHYRRPFAEPGESRRPTLTWPRQAPFDGEPADVTEICSNYRSTGDHHGLRSLAFPQPHSQVIHSRRAGWDGAERTRVLPKLSRAKRDHGARTPLSPGGCS
jgi:haloalkane dehalogenase